MRTVGLCALIAKVSASTSAIPPLADLYLSTLVGTLTGEALRTPSIPFSAENPDAEYHATAEDRSRGKIGCSSCLTMVGSERLRDIWDILETVRLNNVTGDFVQTGVWHGGVAIFARAYFHVFHMDRKVFACDSFMGFPDDTSTAVTRHRFFEVSEEDVAQNFASFALFDDNVLLVKGFFNESLHDLHDRMVADGRRISLLHLDADLYSSHMDVLFNLYDLLEVGGFVICDDCGFIEEAGRAVTDFRILHAIDAPQRVAERSKLTRYWQKTAEVKIEWSIYECWNRSRLPWGLLTGCVGLEVEGLWQWLRDYASRMESTYSSDLQSMMVIAGQHFTSGIAMAEFLNHAIPVLLKDIQREGILQEHVKEGLLLAHTCAEMATELFHREGLEEKQAQAKAWLNSVQEARFRVASLPNWLLPLLV